MVNEREVWVQTVDTALEEWCQGDCVLKEQWFVHRFNPQRPLTADSTDVAQEEVDLTESKVKGFAVVTQTCDIVRSCVDRPFIEVVPLNDQDIRALRQALARKRIRFAFPDDFTQFASKLQKRMQEKHDKKESPEGNALRAPDKK